MEIVRNSELGIIHILERIAGELAVKGREYLKEATAKRGNVDSSVCAAIASSMFETSNIINKIIEENRRG